MVVRAFFLTIVFYQGYKLFNAEVIVSLCVFTPIAGSFFTHKVHRNDCFYDFILDNRKGLFFLLPWCTSNLLEFFFEFFKSAFVIQLTFKFCKIRNRATISLHFIEYLHKDFHDGFFTGADLGRSLGVNIKEHDI